MKTRTKRLAWLAPPIVFAAYVVAAVSLRSDPTGYVASQSIITHSSTDVLDFSDGTVTWRTCCGDEFRGTYSRQPDGLWIWHVQANKTSAPIMHFLVDPGLFSMSITDTANPLKKYVLRRRVFKQWPI